MPIDEYIEWDCDKPTSQHLKIEIVSHSVKSIHCLNEYGDITKEGKVIVFTRKVMKLKTSNVVLHLPDSRRRNG